MVSSVWEMLSDACGMHISVLKAPKNSAANRPFTDVEMGFGKVE